jgi:hypothetical protein
LNANQPNWKLIDLIEITEISRKLSQKANWLNGSLTQKCAHGGKEWNVPKIHVFAVQDQLHGPRWLQSLENTFFQKTPHHFWANARRSSKPTAGYRKSEQYRTTCVTIFITHAPTPPLESLTELDWTKNGDWELLADGVRAEYFSGLECLEGLEALGCLSHVIFYKKGGYKRVPSNGASWNHIRWQYAVLITPQATYVQDSIPWNGIRFHLVGPLFADPRRPSSCAGWRGSSEGAG